MDDRHVAVRAQSLLDLLELSERALELLDTIQPGDALNTCLRGSIAEVRTHSVLEPA